ncbi:MAG TPA: hypothetical protein VNA69_07600 [Thermoanaerobaculia bacterium]|nr:hypothetical protein [Thermoanaerobaculia bacterium]
MLPGFVVAAIRTAPADARDCKTVGEIAQLERDPESPIDPNLSNGLLMKLGGIDRCVGWHDHTATIVQRRIGLMRRGGCRAHECF